MTGRLPLAGLVVVAVEQAVAAPFCTSRLADAGARVIKIERPEGDFARGYDDVAAGQSSYFVWLNRGKESLVLDLARPAGQQAFAQLLEGADVLVQNLKPGALARLGFGAETLRARHPRLIVCSISGYGESGPMADRKAYDLLIQAESGLASITGGPNEPARVGTSVVDIATGATAHAAILEALIGRSVTGEGADIRISMFDVMADWLTVPLLHQEGGLAWPILPSRPTVSSPALMASRSSSRSRASANGRPLPASCWRMTASLPIRASPPMFSGSPTAHRPTAVWPRLLPRWMRARRAAALRLPMWPLPP